MRLWRIVRLEFLSPGMRLACFGSTGALLGMGAYVASISQAASYLSDDPKACVNCHIMTPEYATWQHSSHARVANCNDCHVPHENLVRKYFFKAKDGARHSFMFTFGLEPQVIEAHPESREVIQANCVRCHSTVIGDVARPIHSASGRSCTDCHREVPHGRVHSLSSTPNAAVPPLDPVLPGFLRPKDAQP
ncbi:MAG: cytochrome c nitrite reductase small subunit [Fimbriimonadaceae bacterium]|nr:cytochrome c nitrite reductase small subunit [Fimbriimonadaceae bacterium]